MKKITGIFLALVSAAALGATTVPVQLLNPTGSTSGQAIVSTGASSAPAWTTVANAGANTNITSLTGLTTPLGTWAGGLGSNNSAANGIPVFSAGAVTVTTTPAIAGVTSGACASTGNVGECKQSSIPNGSAVSLTTNTATTITSLPLTAGNWLCSGNTLFLPAGTTVTSAEAAWISSTAPPSIPTTPNSGSYASLASLPNTAGGNANAMPVGVYPVNVTTTTTVYLVGYATFNTSTMAAYGAINCFRWH